MALSDFVFRPLMIVLYAALLRSSVVVVRPDDAPEGRAPGNDPDRILIFGNFAALGWGVPTQQLALPGQVAEAVSARTGRGAETELVSDLHLTVSNSTRWLEDCKLWWFDAVIVTLGMSDAQQLLPSKRWRDNFEVLLRTIVDETPVGTPIVVAGIFSVQRIPIYNAVLGRHGDAHAKVLNAITETICARYDDVIYFLPEAVDLSGSRTTAASLYRKEAVAMANLLAPRLSSPPA